MLNRNQPTYMFQNHWSENTCYFNVSNCKAFVPYSISLSSHLLSSVKIVSTDIKAIFIEINIHISDLMSKLLNMEIHLHLCMKWKFKLARSSENRETWARTSIPINLVFTLATDNVHFYLTFKYNSVPMLALIDGHKIKFYLRQNFFSAGNCKYVTVILQENLQLKYKFCIAVSHKLTQLPFLLLTYEYFIYTVRYVYDPSAFQISHALLYTIFTI